MALTTRKTAKAMITKLMTSEMNRPHAISDPLTTNE